MKKIIAFTGLILLFITGCGAFKKDLRSDFIPLDGTNYNRMNGRYPADLPGDSLNPFFLWNTMAWKDRKPDQEKGMAVVEIFMKNKKTMQLTLFKNNIELEKETIKVKLKKGALVLGNKTKLSGIPLLLWSTKSTNRRVSSAQNGNLLLETRSSGFGMFLMFIAGPPDRYERLEFKPLTE